MFSRLESKSHSSEREQAASLLQLLGWGGFWIQFVLTVVAGLILGFAILDPTLNLRLKSGIGLFGDYNYRRGAGCAEVNRVTNRGIGNKCDAGSGGSSENRRYQPRH